MLVDVFTVQSSVILCRCRRPFDLYCLAATPRAVLEFSPESLDRDSVKICSLHDLLLRKPACFYRAAKGAQKRITAVFPPKSHFA